MTSIKAGQSGSNANAPDVLLLYRVADNDRDVLDEWFGLANFDWPRV